MAQQSENTDGKQHDLQRLKRDVRAAHVIGAAMLVLYPLPLVFSLIALASPVPKGTPLLVLLGAYAFHLVIICYPLVYLWSVAESRKRLDWVYPNSATGIAAIPLLYPAAIVVLASVASVIARV